MLETILALARIFRAQGFELYLVGGTVRDLLLQRDTAPDADLATNARPDDIKRLAHATHPAALITVGEQFGTIRLHYRRAEPLPDMTDESRTHGPEPVAVVASAAPEVDVVEITTYRSDHYDPESRKPVVTFGDTLEGDLLRRDFTINAMARDPLTGEICDPYGGRVDLERKLIRAVGDDPERRFDEDPLRMLRAARFAAQFSFSIEPATAAAIARQAETLQKISRERIRDELTKLLTTPNPALGLRLLVDFDLMPYIVPEVLDLRGVNQQPAGHSKDVYEHVLRVVERTPQRAATRWAGLLHDIAKPRTRTVEDGHVHFYGHEEVGAGMAKDILRRLKFDKPFIEFVSRLVRMHMRANAYMPDWTDGAVRRLMLEAGDALPALLDLSRADITSYRPDKVSRAVARVNELQARCQWLREEAERVPLKSPLDGNDLMAIFGREPGAWLRPVKDHLLGLVIDGKLMPDDRAGAEAEARAFLERAEAPEAGAVPGAIPPSAGPKQLAPNPATEAEQPARSPDGKREARAATRRRSRSALPSDDTPNTTPQDRTLASTRTAARSRDANHRLPAAHAAQGKRREIEFSAESATGVAGTTGQENVSQRDDGN